MDGKDKEPVTKASDGSKDPQKSEKRCPGEDTSKECSLEDLAKVNGGKLENSWRLPPL